MKLSKHLTALIELNSQYAKLVSEQEENMYGRITQEADEAEIKKVQKKIKYRTARLEDSELDMDNWCHLVAKSDAWTLDLLSSDLEDEAYNRGVL
jgi:hypothetical protein